MVFVKAAEEKWISGGLINSFMVCVLMLSSSAQFRRDIRQPADGCLEPRWHFGALGARLVKCHPSSLWRSPLYEDHQFEFGFGWRRLLVELRISASHR